MKNLFVLIVLFTALTATKADAQQAPRDPAAMMQRMKERIKPALMEKTKITDEQADKVIEINFANQRKRRELRMDNALSEEERTKKSTELNEAQSKELKAIPLTDDQVKEVNSFFEEFRKQQMEQRRNAG